MTELELLGLHPDGDRLSLNDSEGNRYILPITDDLRAALRKDVDVTREGSDPKPMTPREIQARFRAGMSVADVSELSSLPASQLAGLASPILAERAYTAQTARSYRQGQDVGGMTLEELVVSRLVPRGVSASSITWDATRESGEPWVLSATYDANQTSYTARWTINTRSHTVDAQNDEAVWLTETHIPAPSTPWRPLNTPRVESAPSVPSPEPARDTSIDDMLASLDSKRGQARAMPEFDGAHPAHSEPEKATDATILTFPSRVTAHESASSATSADDATSTDNQPTLDVEVEEVKPRDKKRRSRPTMPSWDEIVFGAPKSEN